jgi:hypothetical protein
MSLFSKEPTEEAMVNDIKAKLLDREAKWRKAEAVYRNTIDQLQRQLRKAQDPSALTYHPTAVHTGSNSTRTIGRAFPTHHSIGLTITVDAEDLAELLQMGNPEITVTFAPRRDAPKSTEEDGRP